MNEYTDKSQFAFYLEGFILSSLSTTELVLYNLLEQRGEAFGIHDSWTYTQLEYLLSGQNGYSIIIDKPLTSLPDDFKKIIEFVHSHFWGDIIKLNHQRKPFVFSPISNIRVGRVTPRDVSSITIALNTHTRETPWPIQCQAPYFFEAEKYSEIDFKELERFINILPESYSINIIGGDISRYSHLNDLLSILNSHKYTFYSAYELKDVTNVPLTKVYIPMLFNHQNCISNINDCIAIISSEEEFNRLEINAECNIISRIYPYYNSTNGDFFKSLVSISKHSLLKSGLNKYVFFLNKIVNRNAWGKLYISPNGHISDCYGGKVLGTLNSSLTEILNGIDAHSCWYETRETICPNCAYRHICAPVSAYERVNNYKTLCHE